MVHLNFCRSYLLRRQYRRFPSEADCILCSTDDQGRRASHKGARGRREGGKQEASKTSGTILFRIAKEKKIMELDPVNMPGRDALYLQAGANTGASPTPGDIGPRPPDPTDPQYRMGIGLRILGIANNFLQGMAHRAPVVNTGSGATNVQFNHDLDAYHRH